MEKHVVDYRGRPLFKIDLSKGFYRVDEHFIWVHDHGITHVFREIINLIPDFRVTEEEKVVKIDKEEFGTAVRTAIFKTGIYEYVK